MPLPSIRRRVGRLAILFQAPREYPPFTRAEVEDLALRIRTGGPITSEEIARVESKHSVVRGEYIICAARGRMACKHYIGVDLEEAI